MPQELLPSRRSIRLKGFDYSDAGLYFITICAHKRRMLFGTVIADKMALNSVGELIGECWTAISNHFDGIELDACVVMPNHLHGIVIILAKPLQAVNFSDKKKHTEFGNPAAHSLATIVRSFKGAVTRLVRERRLIRTHPVWQRGYFERVIRTGEEYADTSRYILENPLRWSVDEENPDLKIALGENFNGTPVLVGARHVPGGSQLGNLLARARHGVPPQNRAARDPIAARARRQNRGARSAGGGR